MVIALSTKHPNTEMPSFSNSIQPRAHSASLNSLPNHPIQAQHVPSDFLWDTSQFPMLCALPSTAKNNKSNLFKYKGVAGALWMRALIEGSEFINWQLPAYMCFTDILVPQNGMAWARNEPLLDKQASIYTNPPDCNPFLPISWS